ncbi:MAG: TIGR02587 family membrane protein [Paracoccus sp. (in: a-proteobacteria)]
MTTQNNQTAAPRQATDNRRALSDFGRAAAGALIFSLPMLMTMELWYIGLYIERWKLLLFLCSACPFLVVLARQMGFEETRSWTDAVWDSLIAVGVALLTCFAILYMLGIMTSGMGLDNVTGAVTVQLVPASIGALLARSQLGASRACEDDAPESYPRELLLMAIGALFLALNVAPTEEMMLISYKITFLHALVVVIVSLLIMHAFVFSLGFAGGSEVTEDLTTPRAFLFFTLPGYLISILLSLYLLWIFGSLEGLAVGAISKLAVVLAFPASIGAAAARLIL